MVEANYHGKTASAYWKASGGAFAASSNVTEWSINLVASSAVSTVMAAATTGKTREIGFKGGTISIVCNLAGDVEIDEGAIGAVELLRDLTNASGGYATAVLGALCTGVDLGTDKDGIETVTYSFQIKGEVSNTVTQGTV